MKRKTNEEKLAEVIQSLAAPRWNHTYEPHDHFSPGDLVPHNASFKRMCYQLYQAGLLDCVSEGGRWGRFYKVPESSHPEQGGINDS